jgi:hypothetical protein
MFSCSFNLEKKETGFVSFLTWLFLLVDLAVVAGLGVVGVVIYQRRSPRYEVSKISAGNIPMKVALSPKFLLSGAAFWKILEGLDASLRNLPIRVVCRESEVEFRLGDASHPKQRLVVTVGFREGVQRVTEIDHHDLVNKSFTKYRCLENGSFEVSERGELSD